MVADSTTQHDAPSPGAPQQRAMLVPKYTYTGPVDHTIPTDRSRAAGKSVIVTGGANGMGEACVRDFVRAGAFVTIADSDDARGRELERELNDAAAADGREVCVFVKVDIRDWDQVKAVFETARTRSPSRSVDVVLANAGISRNSGDSLWTLHGELFRSILFYFLFFFFWSFGSTGTFVQFSSWHFLSFFLSSKKRFKLLTSERELLDPNDEVAKPDLNIVNVNLVGTLYTWKLAVHYFRKQPESADRDRCFIITGSMVAYIDSPANWEYTATKYG